MTEPAAAFFSRDYLKAFWQRGGGRRKSGLPTLERDVSPLRFPGGKGSIKYFLAAVLSENDIAGGTLIEPFCGGAGGTLPLLKAGLISKLILNDANPAIYSFWASAFENTEDLIGLISATRINITQWKKWRAVIEHPQDHTRLELGFAAFFMNRCNRSGILHAGPIGGYRQEGRYLINCRFNKKTLIRRIEEIAEFRQQVRVCGYDAIELLRQLDGKTAANSLIYLDPPYVTQGRLLYREFAFQAEDHTLLAEFIKRKPWRWLISYDDHQSIHDLYSGRASGVMELSYQMKLKRANVGRELLIASARCKLPTPLVSADQLAVGSGPESQIA